MATSPNGVEWKLLGRITDCFYHNFAAVNKKIQGALGGNFVGADVLFTVPIVVRKSGMTDSSIPKFTGSPSHGRDLIAMKAILGPQYLE
jgi:hypothetical protein